MTIQTNRGLLLANIETTFNTAIALTPNDALEVISPDFTPDITTQRREVVAPDLSPFPALITRRVGKMTFSIEVKGNGNTDGTVPPRVGRLLRACGFSEQSIDTAAECVFRTQGNQANIGDLTFSGTTTAYTGGVYRKLKVEITTGGASGVAEATITAPSEADGADGVAEINEVGVVLTDATEVVLNNVNGNPEIAITPVFGANNPQVGDIYWVHVRPLGTLYRPTSSGFESLTIDMMYPDDSGQSILHRLTGARGTVSMTASVGSFPTFEFEFTGTYHDQVDIATLTGNFEDTDPSAVEYAALALADRYDMKFAGLCAGQFGFDMGNSVSIRDCINGQAASKGAFITSREPTLSYDPEAVLKAVEPIWSYLEQGKSVEWWARHGIVDGNTVLFHAPNSQITNISYGDRNDIRVFNIDGAASRLNGDDELEILFS